MRLWWCILRGRFTRNSFSFLFAHGFGMNHVAKPDAPPHRRARSSPQDRDKRLESSAMHAAGAGANKKRMPIRNNENRPGALRVTGQCASLGQVRAPLLSQPPLPTERPRPAPLPRSARRRPGREAPSFRGWSVPVERRNKHMSTFAELNLSKRRPQGRRAAGVHLPHPGPGAGHPASSSKAATSSPPPAPAPARRPRSLLPVLERICPAPKPRQAGRRGCWW